MRFIYTNQQLAFISEQYKKVGVPELTVAFNLEFELEKTAQQIKSAIKNNRFTCGRKTGALNKGKYSSVTDEQALFLRSGYKSMNCNDLTVAFNREFELEKTFSQVRAFLRNHKCLSGRTGQFNQGDVSWNTGTKGVMKPNSGNFKKGVRPLNYKELGSERVTVDGYIEIKTGEPREWSLKQRVVYEREFGPIPAGHNVRFRDGIRAHCDIENLFLVSDHENALLNRKYKVNHQPLECRDTLVLLARIDAKTASLAE